MMGVHPTAARADRAETLWDRFAAPLRSFVAKRAPREVDTEDVLQDVFVRIQEQLPKLREEDRIDAWIFQIARNVVADAFRRRTRREALGERVTAEGQAQASDDDRAAEASLAGCLASMINELPEPYRQAIELTEIRGMTQAEAARLVGISVSGMKSRVQRGREHLKGIIHGFCRVETDVRGGVIECDPLRADCGASVRPSPCSSDSMGMKETIEAKATETDTIKEPASSGCCGGPAPTDASACCALDEQVKATGGAGCGCGPQAATTSPTAKKKGCC
jgi:RNA polymerase sigma-70 factor (ECF subfamily)